MERFTEDLGLPPSYVLPRLICTACAVLKQEHKQQIRCSFDANRSRGEASVRTSFCGHPRALGLLLGEFVDVLEEITCEVQLGTPE